MHSWLVPRVLFPLHERLSGRRFWTGVRRLRELQWRHPAELETRAVGRARTLVEHAGSHVPHYREVFGAAGVDPAGIRSVDDLARVPITTKAALRRRFPEGTVAANLPARRRLPWVTSGSTGMPFQFYLDRAGIDAWVASRLLFLEWAGTAFWHTEVLVASRRHFYVSGQHVGPLAAQLRRLVLGRRQVWLPGLDLDAGAFRREIARVARHGPYYLWAYASYAGRLARQLLDAGGPLPADPISVVTVAETLTAPVAAAIRQAFRVPPVNHYSCLEIPRLAQSCPDEPDLMHVNSERAIVRIVDDAGRAVAPGQRGRVVVTDLVNEVMPLINYELGDTAVAGPPCRCGRGFPTLAAIEGRVGEVLVTADGRAISAAALGQFLVTVGDIVPRVWEYQAVQEAPGAVELRVVPTARCTAAYRRDLGRRLEELLGRGTRVRIEAVDRVEREPSGKRLVIRSRVGAGAGPAAPASGRGGGTPVAADRPP